jgi:hypothetical protein
MRNAKQIIGCRKAKKGEDTKGLGMIKIRQVSPLTPLSMSKVDITYDEKAEKGII